MAFERRTVDEYFLVGSVGEVDKALAYTPTGAFSPTSIGLIVAHEMLLALAVQCTEGRLHTTVMPDVRNGMADRGRASGVRALTVPSLHLASAAAPQASKSPESPQPPPVASKEYSMAGLNLSVANLIDGNDAAVRASVRSGLTRLHHPLGRYGPIALKSWGWTAYETFSNPEDVDYIVRSACDNVRAAFKDKAPMNNSWEVAYCLGRLTAGATQAAVPIFKGTVPSIEMHSIGMYPDGTLAREPGTPDILQDHGLVERYATFAALLS